MIHTYIHTYIHTSNQQILLWSQSRTHTIPYLPSGLFQRSFIAQVPNRIHPQEAQTLTRATTSPRICFFSVPKLGDEGGVGHHQDILLVHHAVLHTRLNNVALAGVFGSHRRLVRWLCASHLPVLPTFYRWFLEAGLGVPVNEPLEPPVGDAGGTKF